MPATALEKVGLSGELNRPSHLLAFVLASSSIGSLLAYFSGQIAMPLAVRWILVPAVVLLVALVLWAARTGRSDLTRRVVTGVWAGSFATLIYDVVRVPLVHAGLPVFKAISYFGTIILGVPQPTLASEIAGWTYHFSNGIGFAIMYMLLARRPRLFSAVLWGVTLEAVMLVTPYAEIFGYRVTARFLAVTIGSHVFYGIGLWLAARYFWNRSSGPPATWRASPAAWLLGLAWLAGPLGLAAIAADFHKLHATTIPVSPPAYIGPNLYVTWNVPEPDRVGAIWLMTRFVEPGARFHFIEPMSQANFGTPFDLPEAEIRRFHDRSTFEVVLTETGREDEPAMKTLASMCYLTEIRPWALASDPKAAWLAGELSERLVECRNISACIEDGMVWFDETYERLRREESD